jgi:hypothetical protein
MVATPNRVAVLGRTTRDINAADSVADPIAAQTSMEAARSATATVADNSAAALQMVGDGVRVDVGSLG